MGEIYPMIFTNATTIPARLILAVSKGGFYA